MPLSVTRQYRLQMQREHNPPLGAAEINTMYWDDCSKDFLYSKSFHGALAQCSFSKLKKGEVTMPEILTNGSSAKNSDVKVEEGAQKLSRRRQDLKIL
ncbi:MAG: hypothetical protein CMR00_08355 [[Chlorobium] sp. 445]|nr:MAG: hypothetical protein CMR00_08355 [[Chlorobium] sp. 445]